MWSHTYCDRKHEAFWRIWKKCYSDCLQMTGIVDYLSFELKQYCFSVYLHPYKHLSNSEGQTGSMQYPSFFTPEPPSVYQWVSSCLKGEGVPPYPYLPGICERGRLVVLVCIQYVAKLVCFFLFNFQCNVKNYHIEKLLPPPPFCVLLCGFQ